MLKGFAVPRSPLGTAALIPPPPWHFAGDVLAVEYWGDPDLSANALPQGIAPDVRCTGHAVAIFADYQFTAQNEEYLDPARYQCRGFLILLDAEWRGLPIAWCPYAFVDNDAALLRGWICGYPGKLASVQQTRTFAANSAASAPLAHNSSFAACISAHGQQLAQARVTLRERSDRLVGLLDRPIVTRRYFPRVTAGGYERPAVDELVLCISKNISFTNIWIGDGQLTFPEVYGEELDILAPIKVGRGVRFSYSYSVSGCRVLSDLTG
ncbi:acetoacetate decarboxylase family protein [Sphingomonas sp. JC676]|uniref:acetoacetate decarboxylase family protein n=1 Tax=Sphingomonas sp. JC676 TaxID=2768065 RepID=UPI00165796EF|nr:acetoacetate decarboxylase family protein [Sphingomonas sp. JC676]MBC9032655.1 acetoacetate decarboxylase family protein [Sphingomonas sp. JC676]